jgi:hypothetical protein
VTRLSSEGSPFLTAAVASSIAAIVIGFVYWALRIGFENPVVPIAASVGLGLLFINIPVIVSSALERPGAAHQWLTSYSFIWLATFAVIAGIGRAAVRFESSPTILIATLGAAAFLAVLISWLKRTSFRNALLLIAGSGFFGTWAAGVVWGRIYKNPVFLEMLISNGIVHHDAVTLAALGNMLRTYHVASPGLDGLPYMAYHWGTPWLFAQLSNLTGQSVLEFYQLGYPVALIPLFFGGVLAFAAQMQKGEEKQSAAFWAVFLGATVGFIPVTGLDALGVWTSNLTISESYGVAIPFGLMLAATVVEFWRERCEPIFSRSASVLDFAFLAFILAGGLAIAGYLKISVMILGFGALGYAALRVQAWKRPTLILIFLWIAVLVFLTYKRVSLVAHHEGIVPFDFIRSFVPRVWWPFYVLAQLFWTIVYVVLRLRRENAETVRDVAQLIRARKIIDVEIVSVVAIAGLLPGFILHIDGGSAFYFSDVQRWLSVGLILASAGILIPKARVNGLAKAALIFVAIPFIVSMARNSIHWTTRMLKANAELRHSLYPAGESVAMLPGIRSLPRLIDPVKLSEGLRRSANYNPVSGLLALSRLSADEKRLSAVFVPQSEERYWTILKRPGACSFSGFVVPALTGISMVDGMPAPDCKLSPYYGLSLYDKRSHPQTAAEAEPSSVCKRAVGLGFTRVIRLHFDEAGRMSSLTTECAKKS